MLKYTNLLVGSLISTRVFICRHLCSLVKFISMTCTEIGRSKCQCLLPIYMYVMINGFSGFVFRGCIRKTFWLPYAINIFLFLFLWHYNLLCVLRKIQLSHYILMFLVKNRKVFKIEFRFIVTTVEIVWS